MDPKIRNGWIEQFLPRAIELGFKAIAIIKPDFYFNKVAVESVSYKVDKDKLEIVFLITQSRLKNGLKQNSLLRPASNMGISKSLEGRKNNHQQIITQL